MAVIAFFLLQPPFNPHSTIPTQTTLSLSLSLSLSLLPSPMRLITINPKKTLNLNTINPKRLFRSKKDRSAISRSHPNSFGSSSSSSSADLHCQLAQAFRLIDRDNDGVVSMAEVEAVVARLVGAEPTCRDEQLGCMSVEELANRVGSGCDPEEIREAFSVFDEDGDGRISAEELLRVFAAIGDERCTLEECRRMIEGVDSDGDGFVCFEDFSRMMELQG